jgi:hypothetical protein
MSDVLLYNLSNQLTKALQSGNSLQQTFNLLVPQVQSPKVLTPNQQYLGGPADGIYDGGHDGLLCPPRIFLLPFCEGAPGSGFSMRLWSWRAVTHPEGNPNQAVWIPVLVAELACVACSVGGPVAPTEPQIPQRWLSATEMLCDTISLTQGTLGNGGLIQSTGPGTNLVAFAEVDLIGSRFFSFDFQLADNGNPVGMNCLFAKA